MLFIVIRRLPLTIEIKMFWCQTLQSLRKHASVVAFCKNRFRLFLNLKSSGNCNRTYLDDSYRVPTITSLYKIFENRKFTFGSACFAKTYDTVFTNAGATLPAKTKMFANIWAWQNVHLLQLGVLSKFCNF